MAVRVKARAALRRAIDMAAEQLPLFVDGKPKRSRRKKPGPKRRLGSGSPHRERPEITRHEAAHVVLRVHRAVGSLRKRHMYAALREATIALAIGERAYGDRAFRIVHISIQSSHVHLIVEAHDKVALARGMQAFQISAAKHVNRALTKRQRLTRRRKGTVFPDRYHLEVISSPRQARNTLAYVLNNWRKHREDHGQDQRAWNVDPFSSGLQFNGWKERADAVLMWNRRDTYDPLVVYLPTSWLLREGWRRHGLIGFREVPSQKPVAN